MGRTWILLPLSQLCSATGNVVLKRTVSSIVEPRSGVEFAQMVALSPGFWGGLLLFGAGLLLWLRVLAVEQVGRVYPVAVSFSFLLVLAASAIFLGESYSTVHLGGVGLIAIGMALCTWDLGRTNPEQNP